MLPCGAPCGYDQTVITTIQMLSHRSQQWSTKFLIRKRNCFAGACCSEHRDMCTRVVVTQSGIAQKPPSTRIWRTRRYTQLGRCTAVADNLHKWAEHKCSGPHHAASRPVASGPNRQESFGPGWAKLKQPSLKPSKFMIQLCDWST